MKEINGINELNDFIIENQSNVTMMYFGAEWCGPCKKLKEKLKELDTILSMPKLVVGHMDVDEEENEKLLKKYKVESLPTQIFIKLVDNKVTELSRIEGYDYTKLKMEYNKYSSQ